MANSDYLIADNDEHGLEPLPTGGGMLTLPEKIPIYLDFMLFFTIVNIIFENLIVVEIAFFLL